MLISTPRDSGSTIIVAYFVYSNGTAITSAEVEKMLSDPQHYVVLGQLGLKNIVSKCGCRANSVDSVTIKPNK